MSFFPLYLHTKDNNRIKALVEGVYIHAITFGGSYSNHTETMEEAYCNHDGRDDKVVEADIHYNSYFIKDDASSFDLDSY